MYWLIDLKIYYNRQLADLMGIIKEWIRIEQELIILFTSVLPKLKYYINSGYRISIELDTGSRVVLSYGVIGISSWRCEIESSYDQKIKKRWDISRENA